MDEGIARSVLDLARHSADARRLAASGSAREAAEHVKLLVVRLCNAGLAMSAQQAQLLVREHFRPLSAACGRVVGLDSASTAEYLQLSSDLFAAVVDLLHGKPAALAHLLRQLELPVATAALRLGGGALPTAEAKAESAVRAAAEGRRHTRALVCTLSKCVRCGAVRNLELEAVARLLERCGVEAPSARAAAEQAQLELSALVALINTSDSLLKGALCPVHSPLMHSARTH